MRASLFILGAFCLGVGLARLAVIPSWLGSPGFALYALWIFMFLVGFSVGSDKKLRSILANARAAALLLPVATTIGTLAGAALAALILPMALADCLAVGAGFGYYSLSSIFISQYKGPDLGSVALLANIARELLALIFMPLFVRFCGPFAGIASCGCASMDSTLPVIIRAAGANYVMPAIIHGVCLDFSVPFWVTLFCSL